MSGIRFFEVRPGLTIEGDWYDGRVPRNVVVGSNVMIDTTFVFHTFKSKQEIGLRTGNNVTLWRTALSTEETGVIEIGDDCFISNASLICAERLAIGSRVFIAGGVTIADTDFHPIAPAQRVADSIALSPVGDRAHRPKVETAPVVIGDDAWIGFNATILKGVTIGEGAVVAPGSLVLGDIPAGASVAGNPVRLDRPGGGKT